MALVSCGGTTLTTAPSNSADVPLVSRTGTINASAIATTPAGRIPTEPGSTCQRIATIAAADNPGSTQFVIVRTDGWTETTAVVEIADRSGTGWACGQPMVARVGRQGFHPLTQRRSGDDSTPAGTFPLGTMTAPDGQRFSFFGNATDPGVVAGGYRQLRRGDCFGATPNTPGYGHLRHDTSCPGPDDEYLPSVGPYTTVALIGANMEPEVSGDAPGEPPYAAAIFLHRFTYQIAGATSGPTKATSGCVSLAQADLTAVLVQLRSGAQFVMGPTNWLLAQQRG
jgi:L,D-peptidoglycan transpeptidase YkuD (ErfK/YbiS/YcfS/YnhG family)